MTAERPTDPVPDDVLKRASDCPPEPEHDEDDPDTQHEPTEKE